MKQVIALLCLVVLTNSCSAPTGVACGGKPCCSNANTWCLACPQSHCNYVSNTIKQTCEINGWGAATKVTTHLSTQETGPWNDCCQCSCSCFVIGTLVRMKEGYKPIEYVEANQTAMVLSSTGKAWVERAVMFSGGTHKSGLIPNTGFTLSYGNPPQQVTCDATQLFLVREGKKEILLKAEQLDPSKHKLVSSLDFSDVEILSLVPGDILTGLWNIQTDISSTDQNAHLLDVNGVIAGDFYLQTHLKGESPYPRVGTLEYFSSRSWQADANQGGAKIATFSHELPEVTDSRCHPLFPHSEERSQKYHKNQAASSDIELRGRVNQLRLLLEDSFPDMTFEVWWQDPRVNSYTCFNEDEKRIFMYGGLARIVELDWEGLAYAFAVQVGSLIGGAPFRQEDNPFSLSCPGQAHYIASLAVLRKVFAPTETGPVAQYIETISAADTKYKAFWDKYQPKVSLQECKNPLEINSTCIGRTIGAGISLGPKPACWGETVETPSLAKDAKDEL